MIDIAGYYKINVPPQEIKYKKRENYYFEEESESTKKSFALNFGSLGSFYDNFFLRLRYLTEMQRHLDQMSKLTKILNLEV